MKAGHADKNKETRPDALKMKGLRKILRVSWTAKKTNKWVLNKAGVKRELSDTSKVASILWSHHEETRVLPGEILQGTMSLARRRGRPRTTWMDNINTWTGLPAEESIRMTEGRDKWRKYVHCVANPRIEGAKNRTEHQRYRQTLTKHIISRDRLGSEGVMDGGSGERQY